MQLIHEEQKSQKQRKQVPASTSFIWLVSRWIASVATTAYKHLSTPLATTGRSKPLLTLTLRFRRCPHLRWSPLWLCGEISLKRRLVIEKIEHKQKETSREMSWREKPFDWTVIRLRWYHFQSVVWWKLSNFFTPEICRQDSKGPQWKKTTAIWRIPSHQSITAILTVCVCVTMKKGCQTNGKHDKRHRRYFK